MRLYRLWKTLHHPTIPDPEMEALMDDGYVSELKDVSHPVCYRTSGEYKQIGISVYLWHNTSTRTIYMTFQANNEDEARILRSPMILYPLFGNVCVNRFFYRRLLSVIKSLIAYLEVFQEPHILMITGYSVGGAMTQIAAAILGRMFPQFSVKCHTFGCPKPGNDEFARWFSQCVKENYRIIHGNDPVVLLPADYRWSHVAMVTLHFERQLCVHVSYKDIPWYKRFWMRKRIARMLHEKGRIHYEDRFDQYIQHLWNYVRMAKYLQSVPDAEDLQRTPL